MKNKVYIIAEAGVNHNGALMLAKKLVDAAKDAGADAVKFQTFKAERLASKTAPKAAYQKKTTSAHESQFAMLKKLELTKKDHIVLKKYCAKKKITFISSPFDEKSADLLDELNMKIFKIPSGEITNHPFLKHVALKGRPMILSTGMSTLKEVKEAVNIIKKWGNGQLTLLHCVTQYPTPHKDVNLKVIMTLMNAFGLPVGYSDHTEGIVVPIAAVAMGATVIEKHLTLDKKMKGPDHKASLEPHEFKEMISAIKKVEQALGDGVKKPAKSELMNMRVARKSIFSCEQIKKGQRICREDLIMKRPGSGISPKELSKVVGHKAKININEDQLIRWQHIN